MSGEDELVPTLLVVSVFLGLMLLEFLLGRYERQSRKDWIIDVVSAAQLALLLKPAAIFAAVWLASTLWPSGHGRLADLPTWLAFLLVFLPDDFMHYWYHRLAHEHEWMWPMHRTHHTARRYQVTVAFRENWTWLFFMPGFWWMGLMIHVGLGYMVVLSALVIGLHNVILHYGFTWDRRLYQHSVAGPVIRVIERIINTPSLHRGHHGLGQNGVPLGNYGQTLFVWDQLFGTATFLNERMPERYGIISEDHSSWSQQLWWPLFRLPAEEGKARPPEGDPARSA